MSPATINSAGLWANQISAPSAQRPVKANAVAALAGSPASTTAVSGGGSLFADLVSALTGGAVTVNASSEGTTAGAPATTSSTASRSQIAQDVQAFTQSLFQALGSNQSVQGGGHGHGDLRSNLSSLINTLNASSGSSAATGISNASTSANAADPTTAFNKLMTDLGTSTSKAGVANVASTQPASTTLRGVLQHVQQQGSWAASVGHVVHVVA